MQIRPYDNLDEPAVIALWNEELGDAAPHNFPATNIRKKLAVDRDLFLVTAELRSSLAENILALPALSVVRVLIALSAAASFGNL